jgi:hypothetical protein
MIKEASSLREGEKEPVPEILMQSKSQAQALSHPLSMNWPLLSDWDRKLPGSIGSCIIPLWRMEIWRSKLCCALDVEREMPRQPRFARDAAWLKKNQRMFPRTEIGESSRWLALSGILLGFRLMNCPLLMCRAWLMHPISPRYLNFPLAQTFRQSHFQATI